MTRHAMGNTMQPLHQKGYRILMCSNNLVKFPFNKACYTRTLTKMVSSKDAMEETFAGGDQ